MPELPKEVPSPALVKYDVYPWRRYFARYVDYLFWGVILVLLPDSITDLDDEVAKINSHLEGLVFMVTWIPVEALLITLFACTPGKFIGKIRVHNADGTKLNYLQSLKRAFGALFYGQALAIPPLSLICMVYQDTKLRTQGKTVYDRKGNFVVTTKDANIFRILINPAIIVLMFIGIIWLLIWTSQMKLEMEAPRDSESAVISAPSSHNHERVEILKSHFKNIDPIIDIGVKDLDKANIDRIVESHRGCKEMTQTSRIAMLTSLDKDAELDTAIKNSEIIAFTAYYDSADKFLAARIKMLDYLQNHKDEYTIDPKGITFKDKDTDQIFADLDNAAHDAGETRMKALETLEKNINE